VTIELRRPKRLNALIWARARRLSNALTEVASEERGRPVLIIAPVALLCGRRRQSGCGRRIDQRSATRSWSQGCSTGPRQRHSGKCANWLVATVNVQHATPRPGIPSKADVRIRANRPYSIPLYLRLGLLSAQVRDQLPRSTSQRRRRIRLHPDRKACRRTPGALSAREQSGACGTVEARSDDGCGAVTSLFTTRFLLRTVERR
jgi:hypothetical protein